jgi:hypothetical protein
VGGKKTGLGRRIAQQWGVEARHALYSKDGNWFIRFRRFPEALLDPNGYILFQTENEFLECSYLRIRQRVHVPGGISNIPGYRRVVAGQPEPRLGDELVGVSAEFEEGGTQFRIHRYKERKTKAARRKKQVVLAKTGRLQCEVCDFDFAEVYGPRGERFVECHHLIPLGELNQRRKTRLKDLGIVCSNCHRMLHRKPMLTVEELRAIVMSRREQRRSSSEAMQRTPLRGDAEFGR